VSLAVGAPAPGLLAHLAGLGEPDLGEPATAAAVFTATVDAGVLTLPLPGGGATGQRWAALAAPGAADLTLARLAEGHADALAILAELAGPQPAPRSRWAVWAAEPPAAPVRARRQGPTWRLSGRKTWCSGARACTHALVTAHEPEGQRLFAVDLADPRVAPVPGGWAAVGMAGSDSAAVDLRDAPAVPVGGPGGYLQRPGFWHGGAGVAACWYGGAVAVARTLLAAAGRRDVGAHALAHLGAVDAALTATGLWLAAAADEIDRDPADLAGARRRARRVRAAVEATAPEVLDRVGRALGAGPLCQSRGHARRVADLTVYLRQSHAERDLADLGADVAAAAAAGEGPRW
jgi:alkylation response protein AidB-like acyl-CoA dehydrogenase